MATNKLTNPNAQASLAKVHYLPRPHWTREDEIAREKRDRKSRRRVAGPTLRIAEMNRYFDFAYGKVIPGIVGDVEMMLHLLAMTKNRVHEINRWLTERAPWFDDEDIIDAILAKPVWFKQDHLAKRIGLTYEVRELLKIKTIGSCDKTRQERLDLAEAKRQEAKRLKRRAAGIPTREEQNAMSLSQQQPWIARGMSKATWYRHGLNRTPEVRETTQFSCLSSSVREKRTVSRQERTTLTIISSL